MRLRVADATTTAGIPGEALPATGNLLPEAEISITVDGGALESGDAETPLLPVADEQPWESLVTPPGIELQETPTGEGNGVAPLSPTAPLAEAGAEARQAGRPANGDAMSALAATPQNEAQSKPIVAPIPVNTAELSRDAIADARDTRVAPGIQLVVPRESQPRDVSVTQVQQGLVQDDGQPVMQDTAARPTAMPLNQAVPVREESIELPRPVVQLGVTQAATPTPALQPGTLANVASATPQASGTFAAPSQTPLPDLIETPVRDASWGERIGERVVVMANNQLKTAEIRLTPAELGPVRVQVNVEDGAANITFQAQHAVTREAIEQALPRLREMFADSGLSLGQASVGDQNVAGNRDGSGRGDARPAGQSAEFVAADDELPAEERLARRHEGLLDTFA